MTDWNNLLSTKKSAQVVTKFAQGKMSGKQFYQHFSNTVNGGIVRNLLRVYGVVYSRRLARKALGRRGSSSLF